MRLVYRGKAVRVSSASLYNWNVGIVECWNIRFLHQIALIFFSFHFQYCQAVIYLFFCKGFTAFGAFVHLFGLTVVYEIIGKVNSVEAKGKVVDKTEISILAAIA